MKICFFIYTYFIYCIIIVDNRVLIYFEYDVNLFYSILFQVVNIDGQNSNLIYILRC